jgi:CheY-like chemotaxis protein
MGLVLSIGADPSLMRTRQLILEHEGHTVVGVTDEKALTAACEFHSFDVAILSQTLSPKIKQHIVTLIRNRFRAVKILELYSVEQGRALEGADSWIEVPADMPHELSLRVSQLAESA